MLELGRKPRLADKGREQLAVDIAAERLERDLERAAGVVGESALAKLPDRVVALGPRAEDDQDRHALAERQQALSERKRRRVRPVEIVERDRQRSLRRKPREQLRNRGTDPLLDHLRRRVGLAARARRGDHEIERFCKLVRTTAGEPRELGPQRVAEIAHPAHLGQLAEPLAEQAAKRPVGQRLAVGDAPPVEPSRAGAAVLEAAPELGHDSRLADSGLAADEQDPSRPAEHCLDRLDSGAKLVVASDQWRADSGSAGTVELDPTHPAGRHPPGLSLQRKLDRVAEAEPRGGQPMRPGPDEDGSGFGRRLQAGSGVERVSDGAVLELAAFADPPEDREPGLDPNAHREPLDPPPIGDPVAFGRDRVHDLQPGEDRPLGVVLVCGRGSEKSQHSVAGVLEHLATEALDRALHAPDRLGDQVPVVLRVEPLAEGRRSDDIGEQRADNLARLAGARLGRPHRRAAGGAEAGVLSELDGAACACRRHAPSLVLRSVA